MPVRFSSRLPWQRLTNRFTQLQAELRGQGVPLLDLVVSNPTRALPELYRESLLLPLSSPEALRYEPSPQGAVAARQAIADNPDLPIGFVLDLLEARAEGRQSAMPFFPDARRQFTGHA